MNVDKKGYSYAYDDVQPDGGEDQSGKVNAGDPVLFTVTVGGKSAASSGGTSTTQQPMDQQPQQYDRPAPPPPEAQEREGGWKGKIKGFAGKHLH